MPNPDFQAFLLPLLESTRDGEEHSLEYIHDALTRYFELSDEAMKPLIPGGNAQEFQLAVLQAKEHLIKADLIENVQGNFIRITSLGKMVLNRRLNSLDIEYLRRLPGYR
jgi:restriction endonuclease Mrr